MKAMKPRVAFQVPNTLTGEGNLSVDMTFESMEDFSPAAVARKVEALGKLLEARQQLANLITYMDGKSRRGGAAWQAAEGSGAAPALAASAKTPQDSADDPGHALRGEQLMADPQTQQTAAANRASSRRTSFARSCRRSSSPRPTRRTKPSRTRCARSPSRRSSRPAHQPDVVKTIEAIIAEIDHKLTEQINLILHHAGFPEAGKRLARAELSRQQHRDRRDAEDPRHEHLEGGCSARR